MKYNTILFDLDGTLLDTLDDLTDSINYTLIRFNLDTHTKMEVRSYVGNGLKKLVERAIPQGLDYERFDEFYNEFIDYYNSHNRIKTGPYPSTLDTIKYLANNNVKMAIVTNKIQQASESLLKDFFYPEIKVVVGDGNGRNKKPHPDNVNEALKALNITDKDKVLYIGDSDVDAQTAINSNLDYILCTWGFRDKKDLDIYSPIAFIDNISELKEYV